MVERAEGRGGGVGGVIEEARWVVEGRGGECCAREPERKRVCDGVCWAMRVRREDIAARQSIAQDMCHAPRQTKLEGKMALAWHFESDCPSYHFTKRGGDETSRHRRGHIAEQRADDGSRRKTRGDGPG